MLPLWQTWARNEKVKGDMGFFRYYLGFQNPMKPYYRRSLGR